MQNFGVTNKEHYGMLWYFWSGQFCLKLKLKKLKTQGLMVIYDNGTTEGSFQRGPDICNFWKRMNGMLIF